MPNVCIKNAEDGDVMLQMPVIDSEQAFIAKLTPEFAHEMGVRLIQFAEEGRKRQEGANALLSGAVAGHA